jgi:hypothetical protein
LELCLFAPPLEACTWGLFVVPSGHQIYSVGACNDGVKSFLSVVSSPPLKQWAFSFGEI